ncbi:MAG: RC-LH1 core complex protein PufX [Silicimonas sp.]|nr:RC-LH1 core complex protein PufX [Silicimonas sp.]
MSDNDNILGPNSRKFRLTADALALTMKGAGYALVLCLVLVAIGLILTFAAGFLPDEARDADDPSPWSHNIEINADNIRVI